MTALAQQPLPYGSVLAAEALPDPSNLSRPGPAQAVEPNLELDSATGSCVNHWDPGRGTMYGSS